MPQGSNSALSSKSPKRFAPFPPRLSGNPGALVILVRHMGHEIFDQFILNGLPGTVDRKDKAPAACRIGFVPVLDHTHVGLGAIGGPPAHNHPSLAQCGGTNSS